MNRFATATAASIQGSFARRSNDIHSSLRDRHGLRQSHLAFDSHAPTSLSYNRDAACRVARAGI
ncbi:hypothetical protein [Oryzibacter oryziterrae]|uniref:hypothetical protein n=1 Tax=Oryzibacter oryziterrae TaxID=2766474 RepID=UPI001F2C2921|nr:hypothetical protein [Oryzibacter oryziterrae]